MPAKIKPAQIINLNFPVYLNVFSSSLEKSQDKINPVTGLKEYSKPVSLDLAKSENELFAIPVSSAEVPSSKYRNGIVSEKSLYPYLETRQIKVQPGLYQVDNQEIPLNYQNTINITPADILTTDTGIFYAGTQPIVNMADYLYFKREGNSYSLLNLGKTNPAGVETPYFYADGSSSTLLINPYLSMANAEQENVHYGQKQLDNGIVASDSGDSRPSVGELIGINADSGKSLILKVKYFPIGSPSTRELNNYAYSDGKTRITVTVPTGDGPISDWRILETFQEVEAYAQAEDSEVCLLDRMQGKFIFHPSYLPEENTILDGLEADIPSIVTVQKELPAFYSQGQIKIDSGLESEEVLWFYRIDKNRILIQGHTYNHGSNSPIESFTYTEAPIGEIYAFYKPIPLVQVTDPDTKPQVLKKDLQPWLWKNQRSIAVLSKDNLIPYKIKLEILDVPFLRTEGTTLCYGPVSNSNETILLRGRVLTSDNRPVVNQETRTFIVSGSGLINNEADSTAITDDEGYFYCAFSPTPNSQWFIFQKEDVIYQGPNTILKIPGSLDTSIYGTQDENIVFLITKDEGTIGTVGTKYKMDYSHYDLLTPTEQGVIDNMSRTIIEDDYSGRFNTNKNAFVVKGFFSESNPPEQYIGGKLRAYINSDNKLNDFDTADNYTIANIVQWPDFYPSSTPHITLAERQNTYIVFINEVSEISEQRLSHLCFFSKEDEEFFPEDMNGRKSILATTNASSTWKHPEDNTEPERILIPIMSQSYSSSYSGYIVPNILPKVDEEDPFEYKAGYAIFPSLKVTLQSETLADDVMIYSNYVQVEVANGNRDRGVVENKLKTFKVPYGFRLLDTYSEDASTIGTETFLSINNLPGISYGGSGWPFVSYITENGIIYLDNSEGTSLSQIDNQINAVRFNIAISED